MDPVAEIERLRFLVLANMALKGVVTVAFFGTVIYQAIKFRKNREILLKYSKAIRWKVFTSRDNDWEALVEPAHREELGRRRRAMRYVFVALLAFIAVTWGLKMLRTHWMSQVEDIVKNLELPPSGR